MAYISEWAKRGKHEITRTLLFNEESLPAIDMVDWIVIMGGPMNIYEEQRYPWLRREKKFIEAAIKQGKIVCGICFGAQLIADVLGARVYKGEQKEIGWFPVSLCKAVYGSSLFSCFPRTFVAFHWHGDTFDLPAGSEHIAASKGCKNQAFLYGERVVGLQFHLESSEESIRRLVENSQSDLGKGEYIQTADMMMGQCRYITESNRIMQGLLNALTVLVPATEAGNI